MSPDSRMMQLYSQIKEHVLEQTGLKVSSLDIAQIKQKHETYRRPKSENTRKPKFTPEKEAAITKAMRCFGMDMSLLTKKTIFVLTVILKKLIPIKLSRTFVSA